MGLFSNQTFSATLDKLVIDHHRQSAGSGRRRRQEQVRLSKAQVDLVVAAYLDGLTLIELSTAFGADRRVLARHLERRGVNRRGKRLSSVAIDQIIDAYGRGDSLIEVGRRFGVAPTTVAYWLHRRGIALRPRNGWANKQ
jgi:DNA-directed RNA polymerase specialized sigma24 family protein